MKRTIKNCVGTFWLFWVFGVNVVWGRFKVVWGRFKVVWGRKKLSGDVLVILGLAGGTVGGGFLIVVWGLSNSVLV